MLYFATSISIAIETDEYYPQRTQSCDDKKKKRQLVRLTTTTEKSIIGSIPISDTLHTYQIMYFPVRISFVTQLLCVHYTKKTKERPDYGLIKI